MSISNIQLARTGLSAIQAGLSQIGEWMGRAVRWIQLKGESIHFPEIHIPSKIGGALTLVAANMLIFQVAYRIANLLDPEHNSVEGTGWSNFHMQLGAVFAIGYGVGILALTKVVKVPLNTSTCVGLHIATFLGTLLLTIGWELS